MNQTPNGQMHTSAISGVDAAALDAGLRKYMLGVYNYMASGLLLSGVLAIAVFYVEPLRNLVWGTPLGMICTFAPLGIMLAMAFLGKNWGVTAHKVAYWALTATMGISLSSIFARYGLGDITQVFFITAIMFVSLSLFGYTTKKDLSGMGTFLFMGLIGLIVASIVNIFLGSSMMQFIISVIGVLIFAGFTAYDTQSIKSEYVQFRMSGDVAQISGIRGALSLYLDFINMFLFLLQLFGGSDD